MSDNLANTPVSVIADLLTGKTPSATRLAKLGTPSGLVKIQMQEAGHWYDLGGLYDQATADERIGQFMEATKHKTGNSRAFRTRRV